MVYSKIPLSGIYSKDVTEFLDKYIHSSTAYDSRKTNP